MTRYSVQPKDRIFSKCYDFFFYAKNMSTNISKSISKNASIKLSQKRIDNAKHCYKCT